MERERRVSLERLVRQENADKLSVNAGTVFDIGFPFDLRDRRRLGISRRQAWTEAEMAGA